MDVPIPIPIGIKNIATVQGAVWKLNTCESCQQQFAYLWELEASGQDLNFLFLEGEASGERALAKANQNLLLKSQNVIVPIPCPGCGIYQEKMVRLLKQEDRMNAYQTVGTLTAVVSYVFLLLSMQNAWILTLVLNIVGIALVAYGYYVAGQWDPNADDPEERLAIGRRNTIWGEQLSELLKSNPEIVK